MSKDYAKFSPARLERDPVSKKPVIIMACLLVLIASAVTSVLVLQHKGKIHLPTEAMQSPIKKMASIVIAQKTESQVIAKAPEIQDDASAIHFDFYDALPKMQVATSTPPAPVSPAPKPELALKKVIAEPKNIQVAEVAPKPIFSSEQLSELVEVDKPSNQFILHLGEFQNKNAAEQFVRAIKGVSLTATAVRVSSNIFRVQTGPYHDKEEAKSNQARFQRRGIISKIEKLSA